MKKLIISITIASSILYTGLKLLDKYYSNIILANNCEKNFWAIKKEKLELDYVILGSSRAENQIDIKELNKLTTKRGLNLGRNGVGLADNYLILHHFLKKNTTKEIILQVDQFCFNPHESFTYPFSDYLFVPFIEDSITSNVILNKSGFIKYVFWKYIPFIKYAEFNSEYKFFSIKNDYGKNCQSNFDKFGYSVPSTKRKFADFVNGVLIDHRFKEGQLVKNKIPLKLEPLNYFHKINNLAKSKDIKLSIFMSPIHPKFTNSRTDFLPFCERIDSLSKSMALPYYNYNSWKITNPDYFFSDFTHLNAEGVKLFMKQFNENTIKH